MVPPESMRTSRISGSTQDRFRGQKSGFRSLESRDNDQGLKAGFELISACCRSLLRTLLPCARMLVLLSIGLVLLTGCGPPGPRALLKGQQLIEAGKYEKAIARLQQAAQLLPTNAQAWNHLGLAYHGNGQLLPAIRAYRQALTLDNSLSAARFNLGCAYLDHNEPAPAIEQLTSFTYVQPNVPDGWIKLGTAQFRTNRLETAERSFHVALDLQTNNCEALNGLGLIQFQRRRYAEAAAFFDRALSRNPKYAPALLNAAVAAQQLSSKQNALQLYRRYLALKPPDAARIETVANQLDAELNPRSPPPQTIQVHARAAPPAPTNAPAPPVATAPPPPTNAAPVVRTNQVAALPAHPAPAVPRVTNNAFALSNLTAAPEVKARPAPNQAPLDVTRVDNSFVVVPAQDIRHASEVKVPQPIPDALPAPEPASTNAQESLAGHVSPKAPKKGLWERLNPFSSKPKSSNGTEVVRVAAATPDTVVVKSAPPEPTPPPPAETLVMTRRYEYRFPAKRPPGNRLEAQKYVQEGNAAQKAGRFSEAIAKYKRAVQADPACYEAHLNLALASYGAGDWEETLAACEQTLALRPESVDARYWFASALREAKFPQDAADQWLIILQNHPNDFRSHFSVARLYAGPLNQPGLAREHYIKVLELAPSHPDAPRIRNWLVENPPKE